MPRHLSVVATPAPRLTVANPPGSALGPLVVLGLVGIAAWWWMEREKAPASAGSGSGSGSSGSGGDSGSGSGSGGSGSGGGGLTLPSGPTPMPEVTYPGGYGPGCPTPQNYTFHRPQWAQFADPRFLGRVFMFYHPRWYRVSGAVLAEAGIYANRETPISWECFSRYVIDGRELNHVRQITPGGQPPDQV